jgi:hypothetical protein
MATRHWRFWTRAAAWEVPPSARSRKEKGGKGEEGNGKAGRRKQGPPPAGDKDGQKNQPAAATVVAGGIAPESLTGDEAK